MILLPLFTRTSSSRLSKMAVLDIIDVGFHGNGRLGGHQAYFLLLLDFYQCACGTIIEVTMLRRQSLFSNLITCFSKKLDSIHQQRNNLKRRSKHAGITELPSTPKFKARNTTNDFQNK